MKWYKKAGERIKTYHGSPQNIIKFETSFAGKGTDQDGIIIPKDEGIVHYVVFNPDIVTISQ